MNFTNQPMKWNNKGVKPSDNLSTKGYVAKDKPAADTFNYFFNNNQKCLEEIQEKMAENVDLSGTVQTVDYHKSVIALCKAPTVSYGISSYSSGRLTFQRGNGLKVTFSADVAMNAGYGAINRVWASLSLLHGKANVFKPCTFMYNGVMYGGIEVQIEDAAYQEVRFLGVSNFNIFAVDYYNTKTTEVLNEEIYNSLSYDNVLTDTNPLIHNGNKVFDEGNYQNYVPTKTGDGASGTWNITAERAKEISRMCKLSSNGANAGKWIKFGTIDVSSGNWLFGGGLFLFTSIENKHFAGILNATVRSGSSITSCTLCLEWLGLTNHNYKNSVAFVKEADGVYALYQKAINSYSATQIVGVNVSNTSLLASTEYVDEITVEATSVYEVNYDVIKNKPIEDFTVLGNNLYLAEKLGRIGVFPTSTFMEHLSEEGDPNNARQLLVTSPSAQSNMQNAVLLKHIVDGASTTYRMYGEHNKPNASDVGALPVGGGTLNGSLGIGKGFTKVTSDKNVTNFIAYETPNDTNNYRQISIYTPTSSSTSLRDLENSLLYGEMKNGTFRQYKLYGEHNSGQITDSTFGTINSASTLKALNVWKQGNVISGYFYSEGTYKKGEFTHLFTIASGYRPKHFVYPQPYNGSGSSDGQLYIDTSTGKISYKPWSADRTIVQFSFCYICG